MNDTATREGTPQISSDFAARFEAGVRRLGVDLGLSESQVMAALEFTTGDTVDCLRPEELENFQSLGESRLNHVRLCEFCSQVEAAMNAAVNTPLANDLTDLAVEKRVCPACGQKQSHTGLEVFLGRLGITDEMVSNLRSEFQNVDIDEYLNTARHYLHDSTNRATSYAREHPTRVVAGVATLALGAGLLYAALSRDE